MKPARRLRNVDSRQLKWGLGLFFVALLLPSSLLIYQAYDQFKWEAFHQQRQLAEELVQRIDAQYQTFISQEQRRPFTDYQFLNVSAGNRKGVLRRSPLSELNHHSSINGLLGYFQIDDKGRFSSPLLPAATTAEHLGISVQELAQRQQQQAHIQTILINNKLVHVGQTADSVTQSPVPKQRGLSLQSNRDIPQEEQTATKSTPSPRVSSDSLQKGFRNQSAFDELARQDRQRKETTRGKYSLGKLDDLKLDKKFDSDARRQEQTTRKGQSASAEASTTLRARRETSRLPETTPAQTGRPAITTDSEPVRIEIFESEIDPLEFNQLRNGELVLFRKAWRNENRYIQGMLLNAQHFIKNTIEHIFKSSAVAQTSDLTIAIDGDIYSLLPAQTTEDRYGLNSGSERSNQFDGAVLYRARLSPPLNNIELLFSVRHLPVGPGARLITWSAIVLLLVLICGFLLMYRLGHRQIELARQQQDFVSAVSHELKTPLTSIRMYGEMLREGWATEDKKRTYYDYIYAESERLSRLIQNVLQLARITRNESHVELLPRHIGELLDTLRSKVSSMIERQGFELILDCPEDIKQKQICVDVDYFSQIVINLIDNALKFSKDSECKNIEIHCALYRDQFTLSIRDFGPGIARDQLRKIFRLFYRAENELTRQTVGTGIGLALVQQLSTAMQASIEVVNREPGAEFILSFPLHKAARPD